MLLLTSTQHFAVQLIFLERWTLTAIHDVMNAWSGLGAALITLWRQQRVAASVVATLEVTIYLACISILHITTLALFSMETFNNVGSVTTSTIIGMPSITNISYNPYGSLIICYLCNLSCGHPHWQGHIYADAKLLEKHFTTSAISVECQTLINVGSVQQHAL